jgi:hypothetical protein
MSINSQITARGYNKVVANYEMKNKAVQRGDIGRALPTIQDIRRKGFAPTPGNDYMIATDVSGHSR